MAMFDTSKSDGFAVCNNRSYFVRDFAKYRETDGIDIAKRYCYGDPIHVHSRHSLVSYPGIHDVCFLFQAFPWYVFDLLDDSSKGSADIWRDFGQSRYDWVEGLVFVDVYEAAENKKRVKFRRIPSLVRLVALDGNPIRRRGVSKEVRLPKPFAALGDGKDDSGLILGREVARPVGVNGDDLPCYVIEGTAKIGEYVSEKEAERCGGSSSLFNLKLKMSRQAPVQGKRDGADGHHMGLAFEPPTDFCVQRLQVFMRPVELVSRAGEVREHAKSG